jgi:hypothetical protein
MRKQPLALKKVFLEPKQFQASMVLVDHHALTGQDVSLADRVQFHSDFHSVWWATTSRKL